MKEGCPAAPLTIRILLLLKVGGRVDDHVAGNAVIAEPDRDLAGIRARAEAEDERVGPAAGRERRPEVDARGSRVGRAAREEAEVARAGVVDDGDVAHDSEGVGGQPIGASKWSE